MSRFLAKVLRHHLPLLPEAMRLAIMGYHFEKITRQTVAVDDFKQYLETEFSAFKETVAQVVQSKTDRIGEVSIHVHELFARVRAAYEGIHKDFRYSVQDRLDAFQTSVFKEYLKAELAALKSAISRFAKVQSHRVGEIKGYVHKLWERVHAQYDHLHDDLRHSVNDSLETFRDAVKSNLARVPVPQLEGLD